MKKTSTLLLLMAALSLQTFAAKHDFKKFKEAVRKSMQAQPSENNSAARATASRKIANVYYDNGTKEDSSHYFYNNNYPPFAENDLFNNFFELGYKYDSSARYDNGAVTGTTKITYSNQRPITFIDRYGNEGWRYTFGYDAQGRFNQYTFDTLTTGGVWDNQGKAVITYTATSKIDSVKGFDYVAGNYVEGYRSKYTYTVANLLASVTDYGFKAGLWVLDYKSEYTYNGSGKEILYKNYYESNSVFGLQDSTITTYPQANIVLETRFSFYADTIGGGSRSKTILNAAQKPLLEIREEYYDASTKQWKPFTYYDQTTQQSIPKPDTFDIYTYNGFDQEVYNYYGTDLLTYNKNYYETYNAISGIEENNTALSTKLYPNPVQHQLNLTLETIEQGDVSVAIFNASGQLARNYNLPAEKQLQLNIAELPAGIYAINIQHSGKQFSSRFIKTN